MKKLLILFTILIAQLTSGQSLDNATINKIKAKYYGAEASYDKRDYSNALEKINEIEALGNGIILPTAQNLKVKTLIGLKEFSKAKNELEKLQNLSLDENIIKDIASYSDKIDDGIRAKARVEKEKEEARQKELARIEKEKKKQRVYDKYRLFSQKHLNSLYYNYNPYKEFGNSAKETLIWKVNNYNSKSSLFKYGLINKYTGEIVVQAKYDDIEAYSDGLYKVGIEIDPDNKYSKKKYGYINEAGEVIIPIKFKQASSFSNNIAIAYLNEEQKGLINKKGEFILIDEEIIAFRSRAPTEGMIPFYDKKSKMQGFKNTSGDIVVTAKHEVVGNFLNGIARASTKDEQKYYFIDKKGNRTDDKNYAKIDIIDNYFYTLTTDSITDDGIYGITNGKISLKSSARESYSSVKKRNAYKGIRLLGKNLVAIKNNNNFKIYNINTGKLYFTKAYKNVSGSFKDGGLVYVKDETGEYFIDETGKKHLYSELNGDSKKYNLLYDFFSEGLLAVENKSMLNRITFIDKTGREVIKTDYYKTNNYGKDFLYRFLGGVAKVYSKATGKHYLIDKSGETL